MSDKLVAYFSATGVTRQVAKTLAKAAGADLYEIRPETPYTKADLNWQDEKSRSSLEMRDKSFRPPMAGPGVDVAPYKVVLVGFPIWWYVAPTIINTFLEAHDFSGKVVAPFATSGSSGLGDTVAELRPSLSPAARLDPGRLLNGRPTAESLAAWVGSLGG